MKQISRTAEKTYLLLTVDTEASMYRGKPLPISKMVYGEIGGEEYGIARIMDICEGYGVKATFFVSVLESLHFGEGIIKEVCEKIYDRGHDVQLHIHPNWKYDRMFMWEYSLNEQVEIIKDAKEIFFKCLGKYPIAHRAGGLAADYNTLKALKENKIPVDSSFALGYPFCKLNSGFPAKNALCNSEGVLEVPITTFSQLKFGSFKSYRNFDINADTLSELKYVVKSAKRRYLRVVTLLMHSFSFLTRNKDRTEFRSNLKDLKKFELFLKFLKNDSDIKVITFKELYNLYTQNPELLEGKDYLPHTGIIYTSLRACKRFNASWKNKFFVFLILFVVILLMVLMLIFCK